MVDDLFLFLVGGIPPLGLPDLLPIPVGRDEPPEFAIAYANATQAIETDPSNAECYFLRAVITQARGKHPHALADVREALRLQPDMARAWLLLSEVLVSLNEFEYGRNARLKALELEPSLG